MEASLKNQKPNFVGPANLSHQIDIPGPKKTPNEHRNSSNETSGERANKKKKQKSISYRYDNIVSYIYIS